MESNINMELMKKMMIFTRKSHGHRPPEPPFGDHGHRPPEPHFGGLGPHEFGHPEPPFGECGPHGHRPPLSRERLLVVMAESSEGIRQKDLSEKLKIGQSSTSELINKLEDDGYIERRIDESDKRATLLFLTEKGQARATEVADERAAMFEDAFSKLTDDEKKTLSDLLDKLLSE
ncbi:MarR family winged helix-turn-helix transcriptional regulator [Butyrivibrio sp. AE3004]|uniref:MarR family winged helix-turn-helix transcriptional regulator n=1 Tax=Butyrivibrio sp. AE3004 TaxID=1506994 RepID=UPI00068D95E2|nr:MarR family transcriptional regulator [Butyrivibrio sp. AE3004]